MIRAWSTWSIDARSSPEILSSFSLLLKISAKRLTEVARVEASELLAESIKSWKPPPEPLG